MTLGPGAVFMYTRFLLGYCLGDYGMIDKDFSILHRLVSLADIVPGFMPVNMDHSLRILVVLLYVILIFDLLLDA